MSNWNETLQAMTAQQPTLTPQQKTDAAFDRCIAALQDAAQTNALKSREAQRVLGVEVATALFPANLDIRRRMIRSVAIRLIHQLRNSPAEQPFPDDPTVLLLFNMLTEHVNELDGDH